MTAMWMVATGMDYWIEGLQSTRYWVFVASSFPSFFSPFLLGLN